MVNDVRNYSSTTREMVLLGACDVSAGLIALDSIQGLPTVPFTLLLSAGLPNEEVVLATEISGTNVTIERGRGGTTASSHPAGARVLHGLYGGDLQEFQDHLQSTSDVHGVDGALVGETDEQTLTNKTINGDDNTVTNLNGATAIADGSIPNSKLGSNIDADTLAGRKWTASATAPTSPAVNDIWVDIS